MTVKEMIALLQNCVAGGVPETAQVKAWDADSNRFEEVSGCVLAGDGKSVKLQTGVD